MPFGNINNAKRFSYNKRFSYVGNAYDALNAVNIFSNEKLTEYSKSRNLWIQIIRDSDSATLDVTYDAANKVAALTWSAGTDSYISKRYSQVNGATDITISSASDQELVITGGAWIVNTAKYCLFEPVKSLLSVNDIPLSINARMKNKALAAYIIQKDDKPALTGYTSDYVYPIKCSAGLMDFISYAPLMPLWYLQDGTTSVSSHPAPTLAAGVSYLFDTNGNFITSAAVTYEKYLGKFADVIKYHKDFFINDCANFIDDLKNLDTRLLQRIGARHIPIYGILNSCPYMYQIYLDRTAMTPSDTDNTLINIANTTTVVSGGILYIKANRTSASDAAVASLAGKFTITEV
jgi:hypothetical protein